MILYFFNFLFLFFSCSRFVIKLDLIVFVEHIVQFSLINFFFILHMHLYGFFFSILSLYWIINADTKLAGSFEKLLDKQRTILFNIISDIKNWRRWINISRIPICFIYMSVSSLKYLLSIRVLFRTCTKYIKVINWNRLTRIWKK